MKRCKGCDVSFEANARNHQYCTVICRQNAERKRRVTVEVRECKMCPNLIETVGVGPTRRIYCSSDCRNKARLERGRVNKIPFIEANCQTCGGTFQRSTARGGVSLYCSDDCKKLMQAAIKRGITPEQYLLLKEHHKYQCAICGRDEKELPQGLHTDHDHACCTGRLCGKCTRGLLCGDCNSVLGFARDRPDVLRKAAKYLEAYNDRKKNENNAHSYF